MIKREVQQRVSVFNPLIFHPSSVQNKLTCHIHPFSLTGLTHSLSSSSIDAPSLATLYISPFLPSVAQTPCGLDVVCFAPSLKAQWICGVTAIVFPYWSLTGHIEAQQDFKGTKAVYCIVLSSKWRSPSSYGDQSLEMSEERFDGGGSKGGKG